MGVKILFQVWYLDHINWTSYQHVKHFMILINPWCPSAPLFYRMFFKLLNFSVSNFVAVRFTFLDNFNIFAPFWLLLSLFWKMSQNIQDGRSRWRLLQDHEVRPLSYHVRLLTDINGFIETKTDHARSLVTPVTTEFAITKLKPANANAAMKVVIFRFWILQSNEHWLQWRYQVSRATR